MNMIVTLLGFFAGYAILFNYLIIRTKPLNGPQRKLFLITAGPIFLILLITNIALSFKLFPDIMEYLGNGSSSGRGKGITAMLLTTPLPVFALFLWHRILIATQPEVINTYNTLPPVTDCLYPEKIETLRQAPGINSAFIFRKKEFRPLPGYFFIVLNGAVVAALKGGEYTKLPLERSHNEIGCYARISQNVLIGEYYRAGRKYKYNSQVFDVQVGGDMALMLSSDVFHGSSIDRVDMKKAVKYQKKFTYVSAGPRPNDIT